MSQLPIGFRIKDYQINDVLGQGGFGVTYLATDRRRNSLVAIKEHFPASLAVRLPDGSVQPRDPTTAAPFQKTLDDFRTEARLMLRFHHEALPRVRRMLEGGGTSYLIMDFEKGATLKNWSERQSPRALESGLIELLEPIADALGLLHRSRVYHRDIKPENIIVRSDGTPVLIDFGIAHDAMQAAKPADNYVLVSEGFSPIEQYGAGAIGAWSDVYALAATCYDLFARNSPVDARKRHDALRAGRPDPLRPIADASKSYISNGFAQAINKGLEVDPRRRPADVQSFAALLPARNVASTKSARTEFTTLGKIELSHQFRNFALRFIGPLRIPRLTALFDRGQVPATQERQRPAARLSNHAGNRSWVNLMLYVVCAISALGFIAMFIGSLV